MSLTTRGGVRLPLWLFLIPLVGCATARSEQRDAASDGPLAVDGADAAVIANRAPEIVAITDQTLAEEQPLSLQFQISDPDGDPLAIWIEGLPAGARFDRDDLRLDFVPDFTQGGQRYSLTVFASDGQTKRSQQFMIDVADSIAPPVPRVVETAAEAEHQRLTVAQTTDGYLDSPGHAGREIHAVVIVPSGATAQQRRPVEINLHGFSGTPGTQGDGSRFRIYPHDPDNSYWWGYAATLPQGLVDATTVPNYTQRRVLHLLGWLLKTYPGADPDRVYVSGSSMGGAGALALGLQHGRHFCYVESTLGQTVARNHRPLRLEQLATLWGKPDSALPIASGGPSVWEKYDLTRELRDSAEAQDQFVFSYHGKDDEVIHFGAAVIASPTTQRSFYQTLQALHIGHYVVWDEGGHGPTDPVLGSFWSDWNWNRVTDAVTFLRRDRLFPAFSNSSADQDPGNGQGNGKQSWDANRGFAGQVSVAGDTGWNGAIAGARNRFLRWNSATVVDTPERIALALRVIDGDGKPAPQAGYPSVGNKLDASLPVRVDVTLRRVQRFTFKRGETLAWHFAGDSGQIAANGAISIEKLPLTTAWQTLVIERKH